MSKLTRRKFMATSAATCAAVTAASGGKAMAHSHQKQQLIHSVFFWLKRPDSEDDRNALVAGLKTLAQIPEVNSLIVGLPASTESRDVVDNSFQVSELMYFDDIEAQSAYQAHPIHNEFVENHSHLWEKVVVHDSVTV